MNGTTIPSPAEKVSYADMAAFARALVAAGECDASVLRPAMTAIRRSVMVVRDGRMFATDHPDDFINWTDWTHEVFVDRVGSFSVMDQVAKRLSFQVLGHPLDVRGDDYDAMEQVRRGCERRVASVVGRLDRLRAMWPGDDASWEACLSLLCDHQPIAYEELVASRESS